MNWSAINYPGLPIFQKFPTSSDWTPLLENFKRRLLSWGTRWLNLAGKLVFIKPVLCSLPIYQNSLLPAPLRIIHKMENIIRHFFWKGGKNNKKNIPLVSWSKASKEYLEGVLMMKDGSVYSEKNVGLTRHLHSLGPLLMGPSRWDLGWLEVSPSSLEPMVGWGHISSSHKRESSYSLQLKISVVMACHRLLHCASRLQGPQIRSIYPSQPCSVERSLEIENHS